MARTASRKGRAGRKVDRSADAYVRSKPASAADVGVRAPAVDRLEHERARVTSGITLLAGLDEAGRGPLAGPVVAAAVMFPAEWLRGEFPAELAKLNDSKQLTGAQREHYFAWLTSHTEVRYAIAQADAAVIDRINILQATHRAMSDALAQLTPPPAHVLVDGLRVKSLRFPQTPLVKGDARSYSIAAASVLAKVTRDRLMREFDRQFPGYGFAEHKGYGTPAHLAALARLGPCPIHRRSFAPMKAEQAELFVKGGAMSEICCVWRAACGVPGTGIRLRIGFAQHATRSTPHGSE